MDIESVQKAYSRWSRVYDLVFGPTFKLARRRAIDMLELSPGDRVLEVGVGTGLSLPEFPRECPVYGVDISRPMLERAKKRAFRSGNRLVEADVGALPFPEGAFDAVFAPYVVSAVPDPEAMLSEIRRVIRPGARIVLLNHFASANKILAGVEKTVTRTTSSLLGFHADFEVAPVLDRTGFAVESSVKLPPFQYWSAVRVVEVGSQ